MGNVFDLEEWRRVVATSLNELGTSLLDFLPNLLGVILILGIGWGVSRLVGALSGRLLRRVGMDAACERLGVSATLRNAALRSEPSVLVGRLVFWVLMLTFLLSAVEALGLRAVTATIDRLIGYLPNVIAAVLIVVVGLMLARFVRNLVTSGAASADLVQARQLGAAIHGAFIIMVGVLTAEQLGVDTQILLAVITALVAAFSLGVGLAFALGSGDVVRAILAGHYLRQSLAEGDSVEVRGRRGRVERVGSVSTLFRDDEACWSVPNATLLNEIVNR